MSSIRPLPAALGGSAFSVAQARRAGVPYGRLRATDLEAPFFGVRVAKGGADSLETRCRAYLVHDPHAVFSHATAARLWRIPLPGHHEDDSRLHILDVGGRRGTRATGCVGHKTSRHPALHLIGGMQVTAPADTWLALANDLTLDELIVAGDRLLDWRHPLASADTVLAVVQADAGRRGVKRARAAWEEMRPRSRSPRETRVRLALTRGGLPEPELNAEVILDDGYRLHGDLVYRAARILLEYDSEHHRIDDLQWARDLERYNALSRAGWIVVRITRHMSDDAVVAEARRAFRARA